MPEPADPGAVVAATRAWIGTPYILGAALRGVGCDCVGLIRGVLADVAGGDVPKVPGWRADWAGASGRPLFQAAGEYLQPAPHDPRPGDVVALRPGDVVAFRMGGREAHVGILSPGNRVIHAADSVGVVEVPLGPLGDRIAFRAAFPAARGDLLRGS